ncbi:MAG: cystathionine beta-synthase [Bdellovibrionales bacterium]|nr:cystathionine beta-synthase [Bdellovibrionales bacterium]
MEFHNNILEAIGNTPLVRLNRVASRVNGELFAKCEFTNPGGSIKDRIGYYMVEQAEKNGEIRPGGTIIEATSGNTGMGLAIAAAVKGYKSIFVMPDKMSEEKRQNLRAFGAKVVICPTNVPPESPESYYSTAKRLVDETPNCYYANQYHNLLNRETHYYTTGPEIWKQTEGKFDAIVIGMGTCGTISGIGRYLKEKNPKVKVIGVDPKGSILKDFHESGKMVEAHGYVLEGIGEDIIPQNCDFKVIDQIVRIEDKESFLMTRALLTQEGIFAGMSSGAAVVGALKYMASKDNPGRVLVVLPDSGNRYLSKVFNDAWMIENGYMEPNSGKTIRDLITSLHKQKQVLSAKPEDQIGSVVNTMRDKGVSQMPVFKDGKLMGKITETALLRPLFQGVVKPTDTIEGLVDRHYTLVRMDQPIDDLNNIFTNERLAMVEENNEIHYVLTKIDLISYLSQLSGGK